MTAELVRPSLPKPRVHAAVVRRLGHSILSGDLKPGEALPNEARLCADLSISRTALREAIEARGLEVLSLTRAADLLPLIRG